MSAEGTIWSYVVYHRAFHPGFAAELPYVVAIVENADGVRYTGRVVGRREDVAVGRQGAGRLRRRDTRVHAREVGARVSAVLTSCAAPGASTAPGPLAGVRVLELGGEQADYAGLLCAGLGASVVKVEPPEGSPGRHLGPFYGGAADPERSLYFWGYNRGKRSVVLDLAAPDGRSRLDGLLAGADVLIDATPVGSAALVSTSAEYPALVHARLTPFGEDGPWAGFATSDLVSLALGGVVMNCGYDPDPAGHYDLPPIAPQAWHSFHIAGEQLVIGIVSALLYRLRSGLGQKVSVAIHEAVAKNTEIDLMSWVMLRQPVYRQTCRHALATITNPSISYTKDGRWNLSMHVGSRDSRLLRPFMERYGLADGMSELSRWRAARQAYGPVAGASSAATAGVEYVQRLTRRFTLRRTCPGRRRSARDCCGRRSASRTRTRPTSTGCPAARSRTSRTPSWTGRSATR